MSANKNQNTGPSTEYREPLISHQARRRFIRVAGTLIMGTMLGSPEASPSTEALHAERSAVVIAAAPTSFSHSAAGGLSGAERAEIASSLAEELAKGNEKREHENPLIDARAVFDSANYSVDAAGARRLQPAPEHQAGALDPSQVTIARMP